MTDFGQLFDADGAAKFAFQQCVVNRAEDDEIGPAPFSLPRFYDRMRRNSDQKISQTPFTHNAPDFSCGERIDPQVNAVRACSQRDIEPVIDQHPCAMRTGDVNCPSHEIAQRARSQIFFANLNELAACLCGALDGFDLLIIVPITGEECSAVGDQIEQATLPGMDFQWRQVG